MDVWFCESRDHRREAKCELSGSAFPKMRALPSAPGHPCFSLTEDLHGCRSSGGRLLRWTSQKPTSGPEQLPDIPHSRDRRNTPNRDHFSTLTSGLPVSRSNRDRVPQADLNEAAMRRTHSRVAEPTVDVI